jgi:tetrahydromethanopterin S-methyltransferase subunit B
VNIPENITKIGFIKQMMQYVISRITTMIANRSKDSIIRNMQNILMNAIKEKASIKP